MGKPHPIELRQRVVAYVEEGHSHRSAAARFRVSVKFVNDMVLLKRETGALQPRRQGNGGGHGKLEAVRDWIGARMARKGVRRSMIWWPNWRSTMASRSTASRSGGSCAASD